MNFGGETIAYGTSAIIEHCVLQRSIFDLKKGQWTRSLIGPQNFRLICTLNQWFCVLVHFFIIFVFAIKRSIFEEVDGEKFGLLKWALVFTSEIHIINLWQQNFVLKIGTHGRSEQDPFKIATKIRRTHFRLKTMIIFSHLYATPLFRFKYTYVCKHLI